MNTGSAELAGVGGAALADAVTSNGAVAAGAGLGVESPKRLWFTTSACRQGDRWKWAAAEPAVKRWTGLQ